MLSISDNFYYMIFFVIILIILIHILKSCKYSQRISDIFVSPNTNLEYFNTDNKPKDNESKKQSIENLRDLEKKLDISIINLKSRTDKKKNISNELDKINMRGHFIEAIDGRNLNIDELYDTGKIEIIKDYRILRRGEIGCYYSHKIAWELLLNSTKDMTLILEDDAVFCKKFAHKLNKILDEVKDKEWDILYITDNCDMHFGEICSQGEECTNNTFYPKNVGYGLYGYIVKKHCAKYLLDNCDPVRYPVDVYIQKLQVDNDIRVLKTYKPLIKVRSLIDSDTMNIV